MNPKSPAKTAVTLTPSHISIYRLMQRVKYVFSPYILRPFEE